MKNGRFIIFMLILLSPLFLLLLPESTSAAEPSNALGIGCLPTKTRSVENFENWPASVISQFKYEFYKVVTDCSKCGYKNWVVYYTVVGKGSVGGKDCTFFAEGVVVGKYTCEPPELVIKDGELVETNHYINSRFVDWNQKYKQHDKGGNSNFLCHFICHGWNCVDGDESPCLKKLEQKGYNKKNIFCWRWMYRDKNHDGKHDITGRTLKEETDEDRLDFKKLCEQREKEEGVDCRYDSCVHTTHIKEYRESPAPSLGAAADEAEYLEELENWRKAYILEEAVVEVCFYCSCIEFEQWPKTTLREGDLNKAETRLKKLEADLLRNIDQARVTPQFKSIGTASGYVADLTVTSNADEPLTFGLKNTGLEGMLLVNPIEEEQNLVVATVPGISASPTSYEVVDSVTLNPNESITFPIMGYCANFDKKNPSEGIELTLGSLIGMEHTGAFGLDGPLGDTPQMTVIDNLEGTEFPQSFTPEDVLTIKQIALWASQAENKDRTLEDYETRGYLIKKDYIPILRNVLEQSGVNLDEIVALTGKKKEVPAPTPRPTPRPNWWLIGGIIGGCIVVGLLVYLFVWRKRGTPRPSPKS